MRGARVGADVPRHTKAETPCSRCGRLIKTGGNTASRPTCNDCRQAAPEWVKPRRVDAP